MLKLVRKFSWFWVGFLFLSAAKANFTVVDCTSAADRLTLGGGGAELSQTDCEFLEDIWDLDGPNWSNNTNWDTVSDVSNWYGVNLDANNLGRVILNNNGLTGSTSIANPPNQLRTINLSSNNISSDLTSWDLTNNSNLQELELNSNSFTGNITNWNVSGLSSISDFNISSNNFTANLNFWDISGLTTLTIFRINTNVFSGDIAGANWDISGLTNLIHFTAFDNALTGDLGALDFSTLTNLETYMVYRNNLTGDITNWNIDSLVSLVSFSVYGNGFTGNISGWDFSGLTDLQVFNISSLSLTGDISAWDFSALTNLKTFTINNLSVTGDVSAWDFSALTNLQTFRAQSNNLSGNLTTWNISNATALRDFRLNSNNFTGNLGAWNIATLTALDTFYIYDNTFSGDLSTWNLSTLTSLSRFDVANNQFSGTFNNWGLGATLTILDLANNAFSGDIPDFSVYTSLNAGQSSLDFNSFQTADNARNTAADTALGEDWSVTQTIPVENFSFVVADPNVNFSWDDIEYNGVGEYRLYYSTTSGGPYTNLGASVSRGTTNATVPGLNLNNTYYFVAESYSPANTGGNVLQARTSEITIAPTNQITLSGNASVVAENGGTSTYTVVLDAQPVSDVVINVNSSDTNQATAGPNQLTFTNTNWDTAQTITITGVDDNLIQNDSATITLSVDPALSSDEYDTNPNQTHAVTLTDDDFAGFVFNPANVAVAGITVDEDNGTSTFTIALNSQPATDVVLDLNSSDIAEATVGPAQITFTSANWDTPQTITITGIADDFDRNDSAIGTITVNDALSDDTYDSLTDASINISITDNETNGMSFSSPSSTISENGGTTTFTAVLDAEPLGDVVFNVNSSDTNEATAGPALLTFTSANWDTPQTITITGVDDNLAQNDSTTITISVDPALSSDEYDMLPNQNHNVNLTDDDVIVATASGGGSAPQRHIIEMCSNETGQCDSIYPVGTDEVYQTYRTCYQAGNDGFECATQWALSKGYVLPNNFTLSSINTPAKTNNPATTPSNTVDGFGCNAITYERLPMNRGQGVPENLFSDTLPSSLAYPYLIDLAEQQIISGDSNTGFARLDHPITRGETVKIMTIARQDTIKLGTCAELTRFPDVNTAAWYHNFVQNMEYQDIVHGYQDGYYKPGRNINKAELYKIMAIGFNFITVQEAHEAKIARNIEWYVPYIESLQNNVSLPRSIVNLPMDTELTRGQVFEILSRTLRVVDGLDL